MVPIVATERIATTKPNGWSTRVGVERGLRAKEKVRANNSLQKSGEYLRGTAQSIANNA